MVVLLTFNFFLTSFLWFDKSYESVVINERISGLEKTTTEQFAVPEY